MPAAPLPADEAERLAALRGYAILDTPPEENFDRIVRLACRLFSVPIALISLVDENRQWFKARQGLEATETPRDVAFCAHAILEDGVLVVPDATQDQRFADNPLVQGGPGIRFYAGAPLISPTGQRIGTLCLIDTISRTDFSAADRASLRDLGGVVMDEMEMRRTREMIRENEDRYRRLYNKTPAMMYSIDEEGRMLAVSDYWLQHLGYGREEVLGRKSVDFLTPESRDRAVREALPRFFEMGEVRDVPLQFVTRDGGVLDTELSAVAERDQEGRFLNSLTLVRDVTQQKAIEAQFRQAQNLKVAGSNPAPATKIMAPSQRLGAILLFGPVLQRNATRTRKIPNAYGHSRFFRATRMRHGQRRCSPRVRAASHVHAAASVATPSSRTRTVVMPLPAASVAMPTG